MALTVTSRGSGSNKTGATTYGISPASNFAAGLAVFTLAYDNAGTDGADPYSSISDSLGNTWTSRQGALRDPGAAAAGACFRIFTSPQDVGLLATSTTITVSFGAVSVTAKAYTLNQVSPAAANTAAYVTGSTATGAGSTNIVTGSITSGDVVLCGLAHESEASSADDGDTTNGTWTTGQAANTTGGADASNMATRSQAKVTTGTGTQTWDFSAPGDWAAAWIEVNEQVASANQWGTQTELIGWIS